MRETMKMTKKKSRKMITVMEARTKEIARRIVMTTVTMRETMKMTKKKSRKMITVMGARTKEITRRIVMTTVTMRETIATATTVMIMILPRARMTLRSSLETIQTSHARK